MKWGKRVFKVIVQKFLLCMYDIEMLSWIIVYGKIYIYENITRNTVFALVK